MNILILNLRDINNPKSGGAEVFTHEVAKRLVKKGHSVTIICSKFKKCTEQDLIDNVRIIRIGNSFTVFYIFKLLNKKFLKNDFDIIIDEYTHRPFLSSNYLKIPVVYLIHELAREKYFYELPPLVSHVFFHLLEPRWLKKIGDNPVISVSESTKKDLSDFGVNNVYIVDEGLDFEPLDKLEIKNPTPTVLYVGLLKRTNLVMDVILAARKLTNIYPEIQFWIVGRGPLLSRLKRMANETNIHFFGFVTNKVKLDLMANAHVTVFPAVREGWGLVVTESNAMGTPVVGYDVPGLRDSIIDKTTGLLTDCNPDSLAVGVSRLIEDPDFRLMLSNNALMFSKKFSWDNTANQIEKILIGELYK